MHYRASDKLISYTLQVCWLLAILESIYYLLHYVFNNVQMELFSNNTDDYHACNFIKMT